MAVNILSDPEFKLIRDWVYAQVGINLAPAKKPLVMSRLQKRLIHFGLDSFGAYYRLITSGGEAGEPQIALDLLTTNETYFFREPKHFDFLRDRALPARLPGATYRVWSAACSSGEEVWSIAMLLAARLAPGTWEIMGSDVSTRMLTRAQSAHYAMARAEQIPRALLTRFCLRGVRSQEGTFRLMPDLRRRVNFRQINLIAPLPEVGVFDLIFLRNVLIYFDMETKATVVRQLCSVLRPGGFFFCGHSESLHGMNLPLTSLQPAIYQRQDRG
ncbi:MAG: protein-glutamate O-methyltransferase CheR [Gammaproteobacteria bacterium]|nr:protein-glutamate O-methyltransferase CheR [Gammaproteobacteria bacterium]